MKTFKIAIGNKCCVIISLALCVLAFFYANLNTKYAGGLSKNHFSRASPGMTLDELMDVIGPPLCIDGADERGVYSRINVGSQFPLDANRPALEKWIASERFWVAHWSQPRLLKAYDRVQIIFNGSQAVACQWVCLGPMD